MPEAGPARCPDWLVLAQEQWDDVERRNQLLLRALSERHPYARALFSERPLRPREVRDWRWPRARQVAANIWAVRPIRPLPGARLSRLSDRVECLQVARAARRLGLERPMLWTQDPRAAALVDLLPADRLLYDLTDDWAAFESDAARRARVQARIDKLCARAELVLACSRPLERAARKLTTTQVLYVPNAVEDRGGAMATPADIRRLPRPRLGYVGTLHTSRLDVELLAEAARLRPRWSFVLLGPNELDSGDRDRLLGFPNVHDLGVRPHARVRAYLEALDVCLIPHRITEFTRSLDPLKLYEYLAAGRPVVATPVGNASDLQSHVAVATTAKELVGVVERVIAEDGPERVAARREAVAGATWDARARDVEEALGVRPKGEREPGITAVVVSYNTCELLERCLASLRAQIEVELRTVVVDNASADGSVEMVRCRFPEVELVELPDNRGFGGAINVACARDRREYVLLLNSDATLADGGAAALVAAARRHPEAAVVAPRLLNTDGTLQRSAWPFPHAGRIMLEALGLHRPLRRMGILEDLGTWAHDDERIVDFLVGACLLIRADALAEVGGFDERFWLYGEEADLQRRLAARGWRAVFTPAANATHVGGASSRESLPRLRQFYAGQRRFLRKHGGIAAWPAARLALFVGSALRGRWGAAQVALERDRDASRPGVTTSR